MNTAKIFKNGRSQAIRLPKKYRFSTKEVSITPLGRGIVVQPLKKRWKDIFEEFVSIPDNDFLSDREDLPPQEREYLK